MSAKEESLVVDDVRLFQIRCPSCQPNPNCLSVKTQRVGDKSLCVLQCGCMCVAVWLCVCCCVVVRVLLRPMSDCQLCCCVSVAVLLCVCCSVVAMWLYVGGRMLVKVVMRVLSGLH